MTPPRAINLYALLALVIAAQGAILAFVHDFGSPEADVVLGAALAGLGVLAAVGHVWLQGLVIDVPAPVYASLLGIFGAATTLLAGAGMVTQYVGSVDPALTPWVAAIFQGMSLLAGLFAQAFHVQASQKAARLQHG